jgi:hypothetical protein
MHLIAISPLFDSAPAVDRTIPTRQTEDGKPIKIIPVDKTLEVSEEFVLPSQTVEEIINKFDDIAVGYCFCRQRRSLLGDHCSTDAPTLNCFTISLKEGLRRVFIMPPRLRTAQ